MKKIENYPPEFDGFLYSFEGLLERNKKLEKENQELKKELEFEKFDNFIVLGEKIDKLKKAIEILKKFNFKLGQYGNGEYYILIYHAGIIIEIILTQQEFELLKEVLNNEK